MVEEGGAFLNGPASEAILDLLRVNANENVFKTM